MLLALELEELELMMLMKKRAECKLKTDEKIKPIEMFHPEPKPPAQCGVLICLCA